MGRNNGVTEGGGEEKDFVSCVSCLYCDKVSFDRLDAQAYTNHLINDHNVSKNVDMLVELTKQIQASKTDGVMGVENQGNATTKEAKEKPKESSKNKKDKTPLQEKEKKLEYELKEPNLVPLEVKDKNDKGSKNKKQKNRKDSEKMVVKSDSNKEKTDNVKGKKDNEADKILNKPNENESQGKNEPKPIQESKSILKEIEKEDTKTKSKSSNKNKKEKKQTNNKPAPPPKLGGAESGVVESEAMKEVDNILDEWFKGGKEDVDDDIPDELPDIDDAKESTAKSTPKIQEPKKAKQQSKKNAPVSQGETKKKTDVSKKSSEKKAKTVKKDEEKSSLDEVNDILDEWFAGGGTDESKEDEPKIEEISALKADSTMKPKAQNTEKSDLDEVNDILDEWFAGEEKKEEKPKIEEITEPEKTVEVPSPKSDVPCGDCIVCGRLAKASCSMCKHVFYCTRDHQKKDWNNHKEVCKEYGKLPYRVERSQVFGRFLAATKDINEGELILQESPMVIGPRQLTKPVCLGCHKEIASASDMIKCVRCNWPVCSLRCQDSPMHDPECRATKAAGSRIKVEIFNQTNMMYACITILRALALHDGPKKIWEDYTKFDSHLDERIKTPIYSKVNKEKVVFFILHYLGIKRYSDLEILEACGKLDTNCFEIRQNGLNLRAMYRTACILSHDCTPNTRHTFSPDHSINIYTTRPIKKGDVISATYTNSLWPTNQRREHLNMSKCFWCSCNRCRDPTELGSYLSAVRCSRCKGFSDDVQSDDLQYLTPSNPLDLESLWKCGKCTNMQRASQIKSGNQSISAELAQVNKNDCEGLLQFLHKNEPLLGPNNHHIVEVKYTIVSMLGNRPPYILSDLSMELLQVKERFCRELLNVAEFIEPGCTRWRGQLLLELQMAIVALGAGQAEAGMISRGKAKEAAEEGMKTLQVATAILQVEPDMLEVLEDRMKTTSALLAQWED